VQTIGGILGAIVEVRDDKIPPEGRREQQTPRSGSPAAPIHKVLGEEAEAKK